MSSRTTRKNEAPAEIFKAYDIRGRVDEREINPSIVRKIGAAFLEYLGEREVVVGRDCRLSSPDLYQAFIEGALSRATDVWQLGETTTDGLYYASVREQMAGAMVTASHNPPEYNGLKLCRANAVHLGGRELQILKANLRDSEGEQAGRLNDLEIIPDYIDHLLQIIRPGTLTPLRVGLDGGNGMAGLIAERLFERLPLDLSGLYLEPDGSFPNHQADPSNAQNLQELINLVRTESLDLGVAFDGDADRAVFIDDGGEIIHGSTAVALMAEWSLKRHPQAKIVYDAISSRRVAEIIEKYQGRPIRSRVGTPFIRQAIVDNQAVFGGETSGHCYFKENSNIDSGMLTMLIMLQIISEKQQPLSVIRQAFEPYPSSGEIAFEARIDQATLFKKVIQEFGSRAQIDDLDGLTISWPDKWLNLRFSNTEPIIRLNVEALEADDVGPLARRVEDYIRQCLNSKTQ